MTGSYQIEVRSRRIVFKLDIKRNITVIRGDSATGKTTLIGMLSDYEELGKQSGVSVKCLKPCRVLSGTVWESRLEKIRDSIVFIDEGNKFIRSREFAEAVRNSDNYYVLITRENLYNLPYSVDEVYELQKYRSNMKLGRVYNSLRRFYAVTPTERSLFDAEELLTEDSGSGFEFFSFAAKERGLDCISAGGKSNIFAIVSESTKKTVVVADGAAFGPEMDRIYKLQTFLYGKIVLYLPESFEWLVLKSEVLPDQDLGDILDHPENHIDSEKYFSWEQFFTKLLSERTGGTYRQYDKSHLNSFYLQPETVKKILAVIEP